MATMPFQKVRNRSSVFAGPEGGLFDLKFLSGQRQASTPFLAELDDSALIDQITRMKEIDVQRGLNQGEADSLAEMIAEQEGRTQRRVGVEQSQLDELFGGQPSVPSYGIPATGSVPSVPAFDQKAYEDELAKTTTGQRAALDTVFGARQRAGLQSLEDIFSKDRGRAIEEQAALGSRLLSPAGQASIGNVDAARAKAIGDFITSLEGERGQAQFGLESGLPGQILAGKQFGTEAGFKQAGLGISMDELGLREKLGMGELGLREKLGRADLLQTGGQFGQTLGLEKEKLGLERRKSVMDELFNRQSLEQAERLGEQQASAAKDDEFLNTLTGVVGGIGSIAGGGGKLLGGIAALKTAGDVYGGTQKKKKRTAGVPGVFDAN